MGSELRTQTLLGALRGCIQAVWTLGTEPVAEGQESIPWSNLFFPHPKPDFQVGHGFLSSPFSTAPNDNLVSERKGWWGGG